MSPEGKAALSDALYQILLAIRRQDLEHARELTIDALYIVDGKRANEVQKGAP